MTYDEFRSRDRFSREEVLAMAHGRLIDDTPEAFGARLPVPPMLMVDRISHISGGGRKGRIEAERNVRLDDWFFQCHFLGDPVQPGCLGVDGIWQLLGFYCAWKGALGTGRALGCGEVEFAGQIRPHDDVVRYEIDVVRYQELSRSKSSIVIGDARVLVDGNPIYEIRRAKVGVFENLDYADYPWPSEHATGGRLDG